MTNMTLFNLRTVWNYLDSATGSLDNAFISIGSMKAVPEDVRAMVERIDFTAITALKERIEELISEKIY